MSKSSKSEGHADGACPAPPGSGRRLSHSGTVQESFRGGVLLIAAFMLAGLTAVPPAAQAQQQDTLDRARQQRMEQRRQQREAERRERRRERRQEIQAQVRRTAAPPAKAVSEPDSLALVALYDSTDGDNWDENDGWLEAPVAEWHGVTMSGDRVVGLDLAGSYNDPFGLSGSLPPEMGDLTALQNLDLRSNQLTGEIPSELSQLSSLEHLGLDRNQLTGEIPPELSQLSSLGDLGLRSNQLTGEIPPELGQLSSLGDLGLDRNQLTGEIPPELGQLSSLRRLDLYGNRLTGAIPVSFTNLTSMSNSDFGRFKFNGTNLCEPPDSDFQDWLDSIRLAAQ